MVIIIYIPLNIYSIFPNAMASHKLKARRKSHGEAVEGLAFTDSKSHQNILIPDNMIFYSSEREKEKKGGREEGKRGGRRKEEKDHRWETSNRQRLTL